MQVSTTIIPSTPMLQLVPFTPKKGEEVPDFSTVYYDRATKRIMRRTEQKVGAEEMASTMITNKAVMVGSDKDPKFVIRAGRAAIDATEDNVDQMMKEIDSTKKTSAQLKDTLRREREESNRLKRKYEHALKEVEVTKHEIHAIQQEAQAKETTQEALSKAHQEIQDLKSEREQMKTQIEELREQQKDIYESNTLYVRDLQEQLEAAKEQQVDLQPVKDHILAQKARMLQLQTALEEERCQILQIDGRLDEILNTASYFVDRSQDILEVLTSRITRVEDDQEAPAELPVKDKQALKRDHDLIEFAVITAEDFQKTVKKTKGACTEFFRRALVTYNRCQVEAEHRLHKFPDHDTIAGMLQTRQQEDEAKVQCIRALDEPILRNEIKHMAISV